jgi:hypothetical protein
MSASKGLFVSNTPLEAINIPFSSKREKKSQILLSAEALV